MAGKISQETFEAFQAGEEWAITEIFEQEYGKTLELINRTVKCHDTAQDLAHEVFIKLWRYRANIPSAKALLSYLNSTTYSTTADYFNRKTSFPTFSIEEYPIEGIASDSDSDIDVKELNALIEAEVFRMPEQRKKVFIMSRYDGFNSERIAKELNLSKRTVERHIYLALQQIRKAIYLLILWLFFDKIF